MVRNEELEEKIKKAWKAKSKTSLWIWSFVLVIFSAAQSKNGILSYPIATIILLLFYYSILDRISYWRLRRKIKKEVKQCQQ